MQLSFTQTKVLPPSVSLRLNEVCLRLVAWLMMRLSSPSTRHDFAHVSQRAAHCKEESLKMTRKRRHYEMTAFCVLTVKRRARRHL